MNRITSLPETLQKELTTIARDLLPSTTATEFRKEIPADQRVMMGMAMTNIEVFALIALAPHGITGVQTTTTVTKEDVKVVSSGFFNNKLAKCPIKVVETTVKSVEGKKDGQY